MIRVNSRVRLRNPGGPGPGTVVAFYRGSKIAMQGLVDVKWDDEGSTWEHPHDLIEILIENGQQVQQND